ncbi:hypothetical protein U9K52_08375 [Chryseobacterium sp. MHB01]|uniref:hypothetical protein n=1 Tax=Chryseobacterium sp. MHB01 TaxID=3109433 RepID=UPI002AFF5552|nr:hypothetical protein [Chryseobacterium sp. MHB01]MEA1848923.1 hypothetical protein [Chryseobacterium sp. MHB01]
MMQKINEFITENYKTALVSIICSLIVVFFYLIIDNGLKFNNELEYKDIFTFIVNIIFVMFISRSISKNYDSQRKKKDLIIDEVKFVYNICVENFQKLKADNYDLNTYLPYITKIRDEIENVKQIIHLANIPINVDTIFAALNLMVRRVDSTINPGTQSTPISNADKSLIDDHERHIRKQLFHIIYLINNS